MNTSAVAAPPFPASMQTVLSQCDYCGRSAPVAHVRITSEQETWLLCAACILDNHTDTEVQAAYEARLVSRQQQTEQSVTAPALAAPAVEPFTRAAAAGMVVRNWNNEEVDDRQAARLCEGVWTGALDDPDVFHRALRDARLRHADRMHRPLGPRNPTRRHRSGLLFADLGKNPDELHVLLLTLRAYPFSLDMRWTRRLAQLQARYRWLTGTAWSGDHEWSTTA